MDIHVLEPGNIYVSREGETRPDMTRLLKPKSIALVGASPRQGTLGYDMISTLREGGFAGDLFLVNPKYREIFGLPCYQSLADLPAAPDAVVIGVGAPRVEATLRQAIEIGAGGAVIFDNCYLESDQNEKLLDRLKAIASAANFPVCGGNGMGFYNFDENCHVSFQPPRAARKGRIAAILHSGSAFAYLANSDGRFRYSLMVAPGQEIYGTAADYIEYVLDHTDSRAIVLFLEAVRDPVNFETALAKAAARKVPIICLKVARSEAAASLAMSHSAAIAGNDAAYGALFSRYGVIRVSSFEEMVATAQLLSLPRPLGEGGIGAVSDSGGLRELLVDLADELCLPFATLEPETVEKLRAVLPHGLEPVNPLDAAGPLNEDYGQVFDRCLRIMVEDRNLSLIAFEFDARDDHLYMPSFVDLAIEMARHKATQVVVYNSFGLTNNRQLAERLEDNEVPLINGARNLVAAVSHAVELRDFHATRTTHEPRTAGRAVQSFTAALSESEGLALLRGAGIETASSIEAHSLEAAEQAAVEVGYPVALKTAVPGILHKTDVGGVRLNIANADELRAAYVDMREKLGSPVLIQKMIPSGVELAFGMIWDNQFGPLVIVSAGGTLIELLDDKAVSLAPVSVGEARRLISRLKIAKLLGGYRGETGPGIDAAAAALARFSELVCQFGPSLRTADVNPVVVSPGSCTAVDAVFA